MKNGGGGIFFSITFDISICKTRNIWFAHSIQIIMWLGCEYLCTLIFQIKEEKRLNILLCKNTWSNMQLSDL